MYGQLLNLKIIQSFFIRLKLKTTLIIISKRQIYTKELTDMYCNINFSNDSQMTGQSFWGTSIWRPPVSTHARLGIKIEQNLNEFIVKEIEENMNIFEYSNLSRK
jgi:hypothetical protein